MCTGAWYHVFACFNRMWSRPLIHLGHSQNHENMFHQQRSAAETHSDARLVDILLTSRRSPIKVLSQSRNFILMNQELFRNLVGSHRLNQGRDFARW